MHADVIMMVIVQISTLSSYAILTDSRLYVNADSVQELLLSYFLIVTGGWCS